MWEAAEALDAQAQTLARLEREQAEARQERDKARQYLRVVKKDREQDDAETDKLIDAYEALQAQLAACQRERDEALAEAERLRRIILDSAFKKAEAQRRGPALTARVQQLEAALKQEIADLESSGDEELEKVAANLLALLLTHAADPSAPETQG